MDVCLLDGVIVKQDFLRPSGFTVKKAGRGHIPIPIQIVSDNTSGKMETVEKRKFLLLTFISSDSICLKTV